MDDMRQNPVARWMAEDSAAMRDIWLRASGADIE